MLKQGKAVENLQIMSMLSRAFALSKDTANVISMNHIQAKAKVGDSLISLISGTISAATSLSVKLAVQARQKAREAATARFSDLDITITNTLK